MAENQSFQVGQKAFIERDGRILALFWNRDQLDFPGGRVQEGETDLAASLRREVREETGLEVEVGDPFATWLHASRGTYLVGYRCRYVSGEVTLSDEHDGHRWVSVADYGELDDGRAHFAALSRCFALGQTAERDGRAAG